MYKNLNKLQLYIFRIVILSSFTIISAQEKLNFSAQNLETINTDIENKRVFKLNVNISKKNLDLYSDFATHYPDSLKIYLTGNIRMYYNNDSLFCEELILYDKKLNQFSASGNIRFFKDSQKIKSDKLYYTTLDTLNNILVEMMDNVEIKDSLRIITGDTLNINYQDSIIKDILIKKNAKVYNSRYAKIEKNKQQQAFQDILEAKKIFLDFNDSKLTYIELDGMAKTKFNIIKDTLINGLNILSGDSILIHLNNNEIEDLYSKGGARGEFYPEKNNSEVEYEIFYKADEIKYSVLAEESYLIDNAEVEYGNTILQAGEIFADWNKNILEARIKDDVYPSVGGFGENPTYGDLLIYDLIDKKGKIVKGETKYGSGNNQMYYKGEKIYRNKDLVYHISNSILTSCENENPHYYFKSKKMKMIPNNHIFAKPMTLYLHDYPIFSVPFAIFPNKKGKRVSGWIMPSFGNTNSRGTYLDDLGFYLAPNDYMDNLFLIDIYDRSGIEYSNRLRYKQNSGKKWYQSLGGSLYYKKYTKFDTSKVQYKDIFRLYADGKYIQDEDIIFKHTQIFDPFQNLVIDYSRFSNTNFQKTSLREKISQKNSTLMHYSKHWENSSLIIGYNYNNHLLLSEPNSTDDKSTYSSITGPTISFNMKQRNLFKKRDRWYDTVLVGFSSQYSKGTKTLTKVACIDRDRDGLCDLTDDNNIACIDEDSIEGCDYSLISCMDNDDDGLCDECVDDDNDDICDNCIDDNEDGVCDDNFNWANDELETTNYGGLNNTMNFAMSSPFKLINVTPRFTVYYDVANYYKRCDDLVCDTSINEQPREINKIIDRFSWNTSLTISANIYGLIPINLDRINVIRHKMVPSITFGYTPNGGNSFIESDQYYFDGLNFPSDHPIDMLLNTSARPLTRGSQTISVSLENEFQGKSKNDDTPFHLFAYNFSTFFNNDNQQKFGLLNSTLRINKPNGDKIINMAIDYDMYDSQNNLYINKGKFPKLKTINFNMSHTFNLNGQSRKYSENINVTDDTSLMENNNSTVFNIDEYNPQFYKGQLWESTIRVSGDAKYIDKKWEIISPNITINGGVNLTNSWVLTFGGSYNVNQKTITTPNIAISRDLHCWDFKFLWYPQGNSKGFRLKINIKNPDLQDIKVRSTSPGFKN